MVSSLKAWSYILKYPLKSADYPTLPLIHTWAMSGQRPWPANVLKRQCCSMDNSGGHDNHRSIGASFKTYYKHSRPHSESNWSSLYSKDLANILLTTTWASQPLILSTISQTCCYIFKYTTTLFQEGLLLMKLSDPQAVQNTLLILFRKSIWLKASSSYPFFPLHRVYDARQQHAS